MPERHDEPTADEPRKRLPTETPLSRRRVLQVSSVGIIGALGAAGAGIGAASDDHPNSIVLDGTGTSETTAYELLATGSVAAHPDRGSNELENVNGSHVAGEIGQETHAYQFSGTLSYLDVDGPAEVSLRYGDDGGSGTDRLEIVASSDGEVDYEITSSGPVTKVLDNGDRSTDLSDDVTENADGTWVVDGSTRTGSGDTYDFQDGIDRFEPVTGEFTLFLNGEETTVTALTGQEAPEDGTDESTPDREHWYSVEATGEEYADYYIEVEDGGNMVPSTVDDAVIENDYHWINDDGTKAAGRVQPGETHAYAFDTLVADVTIEGEAYPTVNGSESNLDYYPQDSASGDHWKGYFPWHIAGEEREHWYSFEATGEEYADYYIEVEDGGDVIPSTIDGAEIDYEYFWIGDDGTKAAGRIQPGETHAYAFDTLVADVTIEGEAYPTVNGSESNLDYYPQDSASGDHWKTGFPWQDDDHQASGSESVDGGPIGGGEGYANTISSDQADVIVSTRSEFRDALSSASSGDVVYVDGNADIDLGSDTYTVPAGVTLASNRGIDGAPGGRLHTDWKPDYHTSSLEMSRGARLTGVRLQGPYYDYFSPNFYADGAGVNVRGDDCEVDNCEMWGFAYASVASRGENAHIHHNNVHHNPRAGLGYGVSCIGGHPTVEWNTFNANRHSINGGGESGYTVRYNHFGVETFSHVIDVHQPGGTRMEIYNNTVEAVEGAQDGDQRPAVAVRGVPDDVATIYDNWFYNPDEPLDTPDGWSTRAAIIQTDVDDWTNVEWSGNHYGSSEPSADVGHPR